MEENKNYKSTKNDEHSVNRINRNKRPKKKKKSTLEFTLRTLFYYGLAIVVDLVIIWALVKGFTYGYDFSYSVFSDEAKSPGSTQVITIELEDDSSSSDIAQILFDNGLIKDKWVMYAKLKVGEYNGAILGGKYQLSPSMTYQQIINKLCRIEEES